MLSQEKQEVLDKLLAAAEGLVHKTEGVVSDYQSLKQWMMNLGSISKSVL